MRNVQDEVVDDPYDVANVFAAFYDELYRQRQQSEGTHSQDIQEVEPISVEEVQEALQHMEHNKACDRQGIAVEMLKASSTHMLEVIASLFSEIMKQSATIPTEWTLTTIKVIHKKGSTLLPDKRRRGRSRK